MFSSIDYNTLLPSLLLKAFSNCNSLKARPPLSFFDVNSTALTSSLHFCACCSLYGTGFGHPFVWFWINKIPFQVSNTDVIVTSFTSCGFLSARPPRPSLNYADNHVRRPSSDELERNLEETRNLINMFRGLHDAQFVRLSSETIEVLNLVPGLQARQTDLPFQKIEVFESAWRG
ncbi:hypothetical protein D5086_027686 [Populus alba]|uniref:Uncharacterized protein n=1 Tax=Populus alba TaxID=43335 RepID=A0ACC4AW54_POPAL